MKNFLLFLAMLVCGNNFGQDLLFKSNLFDDPRRFIEVTNYPEYKLLKFGFPNDSAIIYKWDYEVVSQAFHQRFDTVFITRKTNRNNTKDSLENLELINVEAGRVFYNSKVKDILIATSNKGPVAGTLGFENKRVLIQRSSKEYEKAYRRDLRNSKKFFKYYKDSINYKNFRIDRLLNKIADTYVNDNEYHSRRYLKKYGFDPFIHKLNKDIYELYDFYIESTIANVKLYIQNEKRLDCLATDLEDIEKSIESDLDLILEKRKLIEENKKALEHSKEKINKMEKMDKIIKYRRKNKDINEITVWEHMKNSKPGTLLFGYLLELDNKYRLENKVKDSTKLRDEIREIDLSLDIIKRRYLDSLASFENCKNQKKNLLFRLSKYKDSLGYETIDTFYMNLLRREAIMKKLLHTYGLELLNLTVDSVKIEITKTFIENIAVYGKFESYDFQKKDFRQFQNTSVTFYNLIPIGISTLSGIDNSLSKVRLSSTIDNQRYELRLEDVIAFYRPELMNGRTDLSPADTAITIVKNNSMQTMRLYKTSSQKLFELKVYSDFVGLNGTAPNGLVQVEFTKEMYLNTRKASIERRKNRYYTWSWGTYVTPTATLSKIEQTNKYAPVFRHDTLQNTYIKTLQLKRYEIFSIGADLNLFVFTVPRWKTQFCLDPGIAFGRTLLVDSIYQGADSSTRVANEFGVNCVVGKVTGKAVFQTDERYFFDVRASLQYQNMLNENVRQVAILNEYHLFRNERFEHKLLFNIGLNAGFAPTSDTKGKIFIRYNYYGLAVSRAKQGFSQIQVGYSYYLNH